MRFLLQKCYYFYLSRLSCILFTQENSKRKFVLEGGCEDNFWRKGYFDPISKLAVTMNSKYFIRVYKMFHQEAILSKMYSIESKIEKTTKVLDVSSYT